MTPADREKLKRNIDAYNEAVKAETVAEHREIFKRLRRAAKQTSEGKEIDAERVSVD